MRILLIVLLSVFLFGCSSLKIITDTDYKVSDIFKAANAEILGKDISLVEYVSDLNLLYDTLDVQSNSPNKSEAGERLKEEVDKIMTIVNDLKLGEITYDMFEIQVETSTAVINGIVGNAEAKLGNK